MDAQPRLSWTFLFVGQYQHLLLLACLIPGAVFIAGPSLYEQTGLGKPASFWFYAGIGTVIVHQLVVWFAWRTQLIFSLFSRVFGKFDMLVWGSIFLPLLVLRPILLVALGIADSGSLGSYRGFQILVGLILLIPSFYTLWSVIKFFGFKRGIGGDHFRNSYRELPLVKEGAFRYSSNAMYSYAFLTLWAIALLAGSRAALASALFQHAYIWVHMYCTETPDMQVIYGKNS
jgi:hypothetical protein